MFGRSQCVIRDCPDCLGDARGIIVPNQVYDGRSSAGDIEGVIASNLTRTPYWLLVALNQPGHYMKGGALMWE